MENAPAFSFIGLSTRVEIYAPPGQRHKVPATLQRWGWTSVTALLPILPQLFLPWHAEGLPTLASLHCSNYISKYHSCQ